MAQIGDEVIPGDLSDSCYIKLRELASRVTEGVILEIGSYKGSSANVMASVASVPVYCVDMWDFAPVDDWRVKRQAEHVFRAADNHGIFLKNTIGLNVIPVKGISWEIAKVWDKPIGLLFIDGDHSYKGCKADYDGFAHHIIEGGYLVFHDYHPKYRERVVRLVDEVKELPMWGEWELTGRTMVARRTSMLQPEGFGKKKEVKWQT